MCADTCPACRCSQFIPQILNEHKRQGEDDRAFEKRVEGKKAAAKRKATRRCKCNRYLVTIVCAHLHPAARKKAQPEPEPELEPVSSRRTENEDEDDMYV